MILIECKDFFGKFHPEIEFFKKRIHIWKAMDRGYGLLQYPRLSQSATYWMLQQS